MLGEPRLAHPGLALDHDQTSAAAAAIEVARQLGQLVLPADQRHGRVLGGGRWSPLHRRGRRALVDGVVQRARLGQWPHTKLAIEHPHALPILVQRLGAVAGGGVQRDQRSMRRLVQVIQRQSTLRVWDRLAGPVGGAQLGNQPVECGLELGSQLPRGCAVPVVPRDAVAQAEAGQQLAAVQRDRPFQRSDRRFAPSSGGHQPPEPSHVDAFRIRLERDRRAIDGQPALAQPAAQRRERAAQRRAAAVGIGVRPEQFDQQIATVGAAHHGQIREQRGGLASVDPERLTVHLDAWRAE